MGSSIESFFGVYIHVLYILQCYHNNIIIHHVYIYIYIRTCKHTCISIPDSSRWCSSITSLVSFFNSGSEKYCTSSGRNTYTQTQHKTHNNHVHHCTSHTVRTCTRTYTLYTCISRCTCVYVPLPLPSCVEESQQ